MNLSKLKDFRTIMLLVLSVAFVVCQIIYITTLTSFAFELVKLIIIYIPCLIFIVINKRTFASLLIAILVAVQAITSISTLVLSVISLKGQLFEFNNLITWIGYLLGAIVCVLIVLSVIKEILDGKIIPKLRLMIYIIGGAYIVVSSYIFFTSEALNLAQYFASHLLIIIEIIHITTEKATTTTVVEDGI